MFWKLQLTVLKQFIPINFGLSMHLVYFIPPHLLTSWLFSWHPTYSMHPVYLIPKSMSNNGNSLELKIVVMTFNIWHMVNAQPCWNKTEKHARRLLADSWRPINLYGRLTFDTYKCITKKMSANNIVPIHKIKFGKHRWCSCDLGLSSRILTIAIGHSPVSIFKCVYN